MKDERYPHISDTKDFPILLSCLSEKEMKLAEQIVADYYAGKFEVEIPRYEEADKTGYREINFDEPFPLTARDERYRSDPHAEELAVVAFKWLEDFEDTGNFIETIQTYADELAEKWGISTQEQEQADANAFKQGGCGLDKVIFVGDLTHKQFELGESCADLVLPATPYELKDAIDRTHLDDGAEMLIEITDYTKFPFLAPYLENCGDLNALNALAEKLASLEDWQIDALEGLVLMEEQKQESFGLPRVYDLAASAKAGACQVLYNVQTDAELGDFYTFNGFVPEAENIPDAAYKLLDMEKIGKKMRQGEGGVYLRHACGYVTQVEDMVEEFKSLDLTPKAPDYAVLLEVSVMDSGESMMVKLPCDWDELDSKLLNLVGHAQGDYSWRCVDCRVPALADAFSTVDDLASANEAAFKLAELTDKGLVTFKALVEAAGITELNDALAYMAHLGEYLCSPQYDTPEAVARDELVFMLGEGEAELAFPYVNLHGYGQKLMEAHHQTMTGYGVIERVDKQPILTVQERNQQQQAQPTMGEMEMTM